MDLVIVFDPAPGPSSGISYEVVGWQETAGSQTSITHTYDLSNAAAGDIAVIFFGRTGGSNLYTTVTLNGTSVLPFEMYSNVTPGYMALYHFAGAGGASWDLVASGPSAGDNWTAIVLVKNAEISDVWSATAQGATISTSATPTNADNILLAAGLGEVGTGGFTSWVNATEVGEWQGDTSWLALAFGTDVSTSGVTVQTTPVNTTPNSNEDARLQVLTFVPKVTLTPSQQFSDAFTRANEALEASANWSQTAITGTFSADIVSNQVVLSNTSGSNNYAVYECQTTLSDDQYAEFTFVGDTATSTNCFTRLIVRGQGDGGAYALELYQFSRTARVVKLTSSNYGFGTVLKNITHAPPDGAKYRLSAKGSVIYVDIDEGGGYVRLCSVTDTSYTGGKAGIAGYINISTDTATIDDFACGNIT